MSLFASSMRPYLIRGRGDTSAAGAGPDRPHRGRHRGQLAPDLGVDRQGPGRAARSSCCSPSSASPATRPRTSCCAGTSWTRPVRRSRPSPRRSRAIVALVGFPERVERPASELEDFDPLIDAFPPPAYNSLAVLAGGEVRAIYRKCDLPNYGVFDERRYFEPGTEPALIEIDGTLVGLTVCEDIWHPGSPEGDEVAAGARLVVNSSASPYHRGKGRAREAMVAERATANGAAFALCNMVGRPGRAGLRRRPVSWSAPTARRSRGRAQFEPELPDLRSDACRRAAAPMAPPPRAASRFSPSSARVRSRRATSSRGSRSRSRTRRPRSTRR